MIRSVSSRALLLPAVALLLIVGAWPIVAGGAVVLGTASASGTAAMDIPGIRPMWQLVLETAAWAGAVAVLAAALGWLPGRLLGAGGDAPAGDGAPSAPRRSARMILRHLLILLPMALPAYVVFYAWWQSWPPGSWFFSLAVEAKRLVEARGATLVLGLAAWAWPIAAWCVAAGRTAPSPTAELLRLDGARWPRRLRAAWSEDARGLALGMLVVFLLVFTQTASFDLAQVFSVGNELRAISALGADPGSVLRASLPAVGVTVLGAVAAWRLIGAPRRHAGPAAHAAGPTGRRMKGAVACIVVVTGVVPAALVLARSGGPAGLMRFLSLYGGSLVESLAVALAAAGCGAALAAGMVAAAHDRSRGVRLLAACTTLLFCILAAIPGTTVGALLDAGYRRPLLPGAAMADDAAGAGTIGAALGAVAMTPAILVAAAVARGGIAGVLLGRWAAMAEAPAVADLRRMDGARRLGPLLASARPQFIAGAAGAGLIGFAMALSEVPATARVHPPGSSPLALRLLDAMHYQRSEEILAACSVLGALALCITLFAAFLLARTTGRAPVLHPAVTRAGAVLLAPLLLLPMTGCSRSADTPPLRTESMFGRPGLSPGQFSYPRGIAVDVAGGAIFIVDKSARIQRFTLDGIPERQWRMPESAWGKPLGLSVTPEGTLLVADTHYHRVIEFTRDGEELRRFGRYGEEPGAFIYPTHAVVAPDGTIFVAEYGGNDRIQVFTREGVALRAFGRHGRGDGAFDRPQAIAFSPDGARLYVADACNHRIVIIDPRTGAALAVIPEDPDRAPAARRRREPVEHDPPERDPGGDAIGAEASPSWRLPDPGSDAVAGARRLAFPYGLCVLDDGRIYVSEFGGSRVQRIDPVTLRLRGARGGLGSEPGRCQYPWSIAAAGDRIFVLDSGNHRVQALQAF